ncbi:phosphatase PAP2 family protein [Bacteroides sp. OttesenSCG-928-J23]|nr:phosphatase PAP2 family protein [Bacteroides sp. OttesenSCG-928-J23]
MLEQLLSLERDLFLAINHYHTPFLDSVMMLYTGFWIWVPLVLFWIGFFVYKKPRKEYLPVLLSLLLVIICTNLLSGLMFKPFFERLRPTFHPDFMHDVKTVLGYTGGGIYGFISGHSTFAFGVASFSASLFRYTPFSLAIFSWALILVYSRLYLGVHFISDVIPGMLLGALIGYAVYLLYRRYLKKKNPEQKDCKESVYSGSRIKLLTVVLVSYVSLIFLIGLF